MFCLFFCFFFLFAFSFFCPSFRFRCRRVRCVSVPGLRRLGFFFAILFFWLLALLFFLCVSVACFFCVAFARGFWPFVCSFLCSFSVASCCPFRSSSGVPPLAVLCDSLLYSSHFCFLLFDNLLDLQAFPNREHGKVWFVRLS